MADFKLRGKTYQVKNTSTLYLKVKACIDNGFADPEDDSRAAYAVSRACPDIPTDIVSYKSSSDFVWTLSEKEFVLFAATITLAMLESQLEETQDSTQRGILLETIKRQKASIADTEKKMDLAIAQGLLQELEKIKPISDPVEVTPVEVVPSTDEEAELMQRLKQIQESKATIK